MSIVHGERPRIISEHIGRLLFKARLADGITAAEMLAPLWLVNVVELDRIEDNPAPPAEVIDLYSANLRALYRRETARLRRPFAARQQRWAGPLDMVLTSHARAGRPSAIWWWGERKDQGGKVPLCYLCNTAICPPLLGIGFPPEWREPIQNHRLAHLRQYERREPVGVLGEIHDA